MKSFECFDISWHCSKTKHSFPKYKIMSYEVVNAFIYKRLYIKIDSKKDNNSLLKYEISYITNKNIRDIKKVIKKSG